MSLVGSNSVLSSPDPFHVLSSVSVQVSAVIGDMRIPSASSSPRLVDDQKTSVQLSPLPSETSPSTPCPLDSAPPTVISFSTFSLSKISTVLLPRLSEVE